MHIINERLRVFGSNFGRAASFLVGALDNFVINVGYILHESNVIAAPHKITANNIKGNERARIPNMNTVVYRGSAHVHANFTRRNRLKFNFRAGLCVVDFHIKSLSLFTAEELSQETPNLMSAC